MTQAPVAEQDPARRDQPDARAPALADSASSLGARHRLKAGPPAPLALLAALDDHAAWLGRASHAARHHETGQGAAAEWLLDNDYLAQRAIVRVGEDMPARFYRRLPALDDRDGGFAGLPRIYALAHALLDQSGMQLSRTLVEQFILAYQQQAALRIAELWALPTMLRITCLERLTIGIERMFPEVPASRAVQPEVRRLEAAEPESTRADAIGRALSNLRVIGRIAWKDVFDATSVVEAILQRDPAGVYAQTDFATRDRWRKTIEDFAARSGMEEGSIAETVLAHCAKGHADHGTQPGDPADDGALERHVGFWLEGEGRERLAGIVKVQDRLRHRAIRAARSINGPLYATALMLVSAAAAAIPLAYLDRSGASPAMLWLGLALVLLPASVLGVNLVNWLVTQLVRPNSLPRLDFSKGISGACPTAIVMPVLIARASNVESVAAQLETHRLANPDPLLRFVLLSDHPDAPAETMPEDLEREQALVRAIEHLNARYGAPGAEGAGTGGPFHLLHRPRRFNPAQGCWMGWERKRGKLEQLNALLLHGDQSGFSLTVGEGAALAGIRFVVTVDADTRLPPSTVAKLVGTIAHPLNRARFDPTTGRVTRGYTVLQPRVNIAPGHAARSAFAWLTAGDTSIDIYSRAVSDVYQDLFGTGIFAGKGIYDVAAFQRSLDGRVPENRILSHDLFEGLHGRAGLVSDVVVHEQIPSTYLQHSARSHRWIRGDWQLLPWLGRRVPGPGTQRLATRFSLLGRWQIFDNLRRSLVPPGLVALALAGWFVLPGHPLVWTALSVLVLGAHLFTDIATAMSRRIAASAPRTLMATLREGFGRFALSAVFLLCDARNALDAIGRTLWRLQAGRNLLEWTSAAELEARVQADDPHHKAWKQLWPSTLLALAIAAVLAVASPAALPWAMPLLLLWGIAPAVAARTSRLASRPEPPLPVADIRYLRGIARRTWLFFETFVRPEDHWLPPDNFQEAPPSGMARRTSPTNIGMLFLSSVTAWRLGHVGLPELVERTRNTLDTLDRLEQVRGHLLNWVETRDLGSLEPRYISTVDSGNLAGSLIALRQGFALARSGPVWSPALWDGLIDLLHLLQEAMSTPQASEPFNGAYRPEIAAMVRDIELARDDPSQWIPCLDALGDDRFPAMAAGLQQAVASASASAAPADTLRDVQAWLERGRHHLFAMRRDMDTLAPWHRLLAAPPAGAESLATRLSGLLPLHLPMTEAAAAGERARQAVDAATPDAGPAMESWLQQLRLAVSRGVGMLVQLHDSLASLEGRCHAMAQGMDFAMLYDPSTRLLHIGFDVSAGLMDPHHYDLLATEARLASFLAIAKGDVPIEHWSHLGRPITQRGRASALMSWSGSMFEYLMPSLLMASEPHTLLGHSCGTAIDWQQARGQALGVPWGVSESGYAAQDSEGNYRYRAFGIPELGIRRGLEDDLVISPYASIMALPFRPAASVANMRRLEALGLLGRYGFFEAADFTPERVPAGASMVPVRSYMAHHQGMSLAALGNHLADNVLVRLFLSDPQMRMLDSLLHERLPLDAPIDPSAMVSAGKPVEPQAPMVPGLHPWKPAPGPGFAELHALGNGRLTSRLTSDASGSLTWRNHLLVRALGASVRGEGGTALLLKDRDSGLIWPLGPSDIDAPAEEGRDATWHQHMLEFHHRRHGMTATILTGVAPGDDIEIRRITLVNETETSRRLSLSSCHEVILAPAAEHDRHPAFSRLFVGASWLDELQALLFTRRPRRPEDRSPVLLHRLVADSPDILLMGFETDRRVFLGRHGSPRMPAALHRERLAGATGWTLDPVMALQVGITLAPYGRCDLALVTIAAETPEEAQAIAARHATRESLDWAMESALAAKARDAQERGLKPDALPLAQRLLSTLLLARSFPPWPPSEQGPGPHQTDLWASGISGDHPILAIRVGAGKTSAMLDLALKAHRMWHDSGIRIDLCLLHQGATGYLEPVKDQLQGQLRAAGSLELLGHRGGVHLVHEDADAGHPSRAVAASAAVLLNADPAEADLSAQLDRELAPGPGTPRFLPARYGEPDPWQGQADAEAAAAKPKGNTQRLLDNGFGGFCPESGDYVIETGSERPAPPAPWCNVLANRRFGTIVTEAGLGFTWSENAGENRLSPWRNDPVGDPQVEALYLRDEATARIWTPTPLPAGASATGTVRHRPGATEWHGLAEGLEQELLVFVAADDPVKLLRLRLRNPGLHLRRVTATYYVEWLLGAIAGAADPFLSARHDPEAAAIMARNSRNPDFANRIAFVSSTLPPHSVTTSRPAFLGPGPGMDRPTGLQHWDLGRDWHSRGDCCAAYQVHLEIEAGAEEEVVFILGQGEDADEASSICRRWRDPGRVEEECRRLDQRWADRLGAVQVETPDPAFDLMINRWLPTQLISSRLCARAGPYQASGAFGFRDQLQDVLALILSDPQWARSHILEAAAHQFEEGDVLHWWHPPGGQGVRTRFSDDLLWLPYCAAHYVEATGDVAILSEPVPFLRAAPLGQEEEDRYARFAAAPDAAPLFDHLERALGRGYRLGGDGLPLMGAGDWNDGMDRVGREGRGQSVWLAWFLIATIDGFVKLCPSADRDDLVAEWLGRRDALVRAIEAKAWDGSWYLRAIDDHGQPWGSARNAECRIDLLSQAWAVLTGAGDPDRARQAMESASRLLMRADDDIIRLLTPAFHATQRDPGYIKAYPPGIRENGGQYTHAAAWLGMAFARLGDATRAKEVFDRINPAVRAKTAEGAARGLTEPYAVAADIGGEPPHEGRGGWSWYTGAAAWAWRLGVEAMLGIRLRGGALVIEPCLPPDWPGCTARIRRGNGSIRIVMERATAPDAPVGQMVVDGKAWTGDIPFPVDGSERCVHLVVGQPETSDGPAGPAPARPPGHPGEARHGGS